MQGLSIYMGHMWFANKSTNNNVAYFFVSEFKMVYYDNY